MKLRTLIVEDEPPARRRLARLLEETGQVELVGEADTVRDAVTKIKQTEPDVVFLDIQIPGGDGFDVLERLEEIPSVVFVTAYDEYAVRAFEADAVDYVVKPATAERIREALEKVSRRIEREKPHEGLAKLLVKQPGMPTRLVARRRGRIVLLDPVQITHVTADHTLVFAWKDGESYLVPRTLQEVEDQLTEHGFRRTHRSALVNLSFIGSVKPGESGNFVLELNDALHTEVPLSRRRARAVREEIGF
ncbi:MAG: response regulator transcription factor [Acidobacteria bacterium]|nr:response regulator transcription factor [Acidobacteriota bacterium]